MAAATAAAAGNWRTIDVDALDPDAPANFDVAALAPAVAAPSAADAQAATAHVRQALRGGDAEGALRDALALAPFGGDERGKEAHLAAVMEVLQSIRQADMSPMLGRLYKGEGGAEALDTLMKYIYKGMAQSSPAGSKHASPQSTGFSQMQGRQLGGGEGGGHGMSVLLSWHEKVVEIAGLGCIMRVMTDRRTV